MQASVHVAFTWLASTWHGILYHRIYIRVLDGNLMQTEDTFTWLEFVYIAACCSTPIMLLLAARLT